MQEHAYQVCTGTVYISFISAGLSVSMAVASFSSLQVKESLFLNWGDSFFHPFFPKYSVLNDEETVSIED